MIIITGFSQAKELKYTKKSKTTSQLFWNRSFKKEVLALLEI